MCCGKIQNDIVDLVCLNLRFNSQRNYNVLFETKGDLAPAPIMAFADTWTWSPFLYEECMDDQRSRANVWEFARVLDRENALLGLFICFRGTREMRQEAEKMGFADSIGGTRKVPRLQLLTIRELLEEGKQFVIPEGWRLPRTSSGTRQSQPSSQYPIPEPDVE